MIAPGPPERACWKQFAALWGDGKKSRIAHLNAIIIIIIIKNVPDSWYGIIPDRQSFVWVTRLCTLLKGSGLEQTKSFIKVLNQMALKRWVCAFLDIVLEILLTNYRRWRRDHWCRIQLLCNIRVLRFIVGGEREGGGRGNYSCNPQLNLNRVSSPPSSVYRFSR